MTLMTRNAPKRLSSLLLAISLLCSSGCASEPTIIRTCPPAIPLTGEVIDGYAACPANDAFDHYMDEVERQQELLEAK